MAFAIGVLAVALLLGAGVFGATSSSRAGPASSAAVPLTHGYRDGPPPGFAGGFGEPSCDACHFDAELNEAPGLVSISGAPGRYRPGEAYPLAVTLTRPGMAIGGFQLTARFEADGAQAGTLAPAPDDADRAAVTSSFDILYAHHLLAGTAPVAPDTARWTLLWTAPAAGGTVLFHLAANAADGDDSAAGDYVYAASAAAKPTVD